jgi:flagellar basal-body rod modification protein FlgD
MSKLQLTGDQYMKLLLTQMKHQNPMDPMNNSEMLSQVAQLASLEATNNLKSGFQEIMKLVNLTGGANLVGKEIEYRSGDGTVRATVDAVRTTEGELHVECGEESFGLSQIVRVL